MRFGHCKTCWWWKEGFCYMRYNKTEESSYCPDHWNRKKGDEEETWMRQKLMDEEDLMIGDLVYYSYANPFVTKVIDVCDHGEEPFIRCKRDEKDNLYKQDQLEDFHIGILRPILLTPEILAKNGFKEDFESNGIYWRPDCRKFCIVKELDTWYFAFRVLANTVDKSSGYICISECNYVHKLQHKLKDLEIEKEIIL